MDAHEPVTLEEGDRYPLAPPERSALLADTVTRRIRSEVTLKGGSLPTERPLAMRERNPSGSGWRPCVMTPKV
jgi:hypothetical protein